MAAPPFLLRLIGGIVPPEDVEQLESQGVAKLFGPGTSTQDIVAYITGWASQASE